jgi:glycosyltransferase involved in cell wall biosynthesis
MRVALVVTGGVDESGRDRVIPLLLAFVERLAARHELFVYVLRYHDQPRTYRLLGATVRDLGSPAGIRGQYTALVRALRKDGPFDVVHGYWALPGGLTAALAGRRLGVPSVVTLASGELVWIPDIGYGLQGRLRQRLAVAATLRMAGRVTVTTRYMRDLARRRGVDPPVIPFGIDTSAFTPGAPMPDAPARLLHVARLSPVKDQGTLLAAFRSALKRLPGLHLEIVGEDSLAGAVQAQAASLGVASHVTFHGLLASPDLVPLYRRANLVVMSSLHEACGAVALEAASCGVPAVGTAVGHLADWAPDRAFVVPPRHPELLAEAIVAAVRDPARRAAVAHAARAWTLQHDAAWTVEQFDRLYHDLVR